LLKAQDWHRWDEVLRRVKWLARTNQVHRQKISGTALVRYRAKALAGKGRLPEALADFATCENQPGCPSWLYKSLVAGIYDTARHHEKALELMREALAEKPLPSLYIGLARRLLKCKRDLADVKAALAEAEKGILVEDLERPKVLLCHGDVAKLEKNYSLAKQHYQAALEILERTRHLPLRDGQIYPTKARLCCVVAAHGDLAAAKRYFLEATDYLVATGRTELIAECQAALGETNF
jgi:tetratricopeptide (TPR) repeat protein